MHLLTLVFVSHEFVAAGSPPAFLFHTLGSILLAGHDWDNAPVTFTAFSLGALMLNHLLYRPGSCLDGSRLLAFSRLRRFSPRV
jgi:hypothetical protein